MSLITIDDDSSDEMAVNSDAGDAPEAGTVLSNEVLDKKSASQEAVPISMEEESCDTVTLETCNEPEDKPILELMKHLINYNGKQNTTLTNTQLIGILKNEFHIDVTNLHFLTVDIYMNVLKKFLKDWPQWDDFDRVMHESRCMNDSEEIEKMLESEYQSLKAYLAGMLKACKPFAREAAQSAKQMLDVPSSSHQPAVSDEVVLEVHCTRNQLNTLFFRKPHPGFNNTIFNIEGSVPKRINLEDLNFKAILNWSHITVTVNINCFKYKRELVHDFKHKLVNRKLQREVEEIEVNQHLQMSKNNKVGPTVSKKDVKLLIEKIMCSFRYSLDIQPDVNILYQTIINDIDILPEDFNVQSVFRHYMNPYPYVRYLCEDVNTESDKYDLQLQEIVSPRLKFSVMRVCLQTSAFNNDIGWLKLECTYCNLNFIGLEGIAQLKNHFKDAHQNEPDWMCMNCEETFSTKDLAMQRWLHNCFFFQS